jgi:Na+-translocating ferredoxin:NAD+ oxidoreductase RNF subunit RnfB
LSSVVLYSVISLTALGALFGLGLALAARRFAVERDERVDRIDEILPGANCGGCGFAGCLGFARALVEGKAEPADCAPGGAETASAVAKILGLENVARVPVVAMVGCRGGDRVELKLDYDGVPTCAAASLICDNVRACSYGCIGLADCVEACPFDAIHLVDGYAVVDDVKCTGCGKCVGACPKRIIYLVPRSKKVRVACSSLDRGKSVKSICEVGCISCGICAKNCPVDCIEIKNSLAVIDQEACINCGICAAKCPTKSIVDRVTARPRAVIGPSCTGCGDCVKACLFKAIEGEPGEKHAVIHEKCIGCGLCRDACKEGAVTIAGALGHLPEE